MDTKDVALAGPAEKSEAADYMREFSATLEMCTMPEWASKNEEICPKPVLHTDK